LQRQEAKIEAPGEILKNARPFLCQGSIPVDTHRISPAKVSYLESRVAAAKAWNDHLGHKVLRENMMMPGKTIEVAGQALLPHSPQLTGYKPIELTARRDLVPCELLF
jgi:hypothetical protein